MFFRVKRVTKMTEKVAVGVLSGAVKVSGFVTRSVANTKAGKKFFSLLPGEMVLATLDGFSKSNIFLSLFPTHFDIFWNLYVSRFCYLLFYLFSLLLQVR